ncbi:MAG: dipeptidyl-peptidase 3 family protein [Betaproteobacteria bacterium]
MPRSTRRSAPLVLVVAGVLTAGSGGALAARFAGAPADVPDAARLRAMTARFAPVDIGADLRPLPASERRALAATIAAARVVDAIFLRQVWAGNDALLLQLLGDRSPLGQARLHAFLLDKGPWSRLDHDAPFVPGVPSKPEGANFYPADATKAELEAWMKSLPEDARSAAQGFFTTIRRGPDGRLAAVPYSLEYQGELERAAQLLREAAAATAQPTLKRFLETRAAAFLSNDYHESDVAWMELDASIEPTIGPYETYEDGWFGYKAAFEAFVALRDDAETAKLARLGAELQGLEDRLPIEPSLRNPRLGALAPIRVVDLVFAAGDGNRGVQTTAYNLPNDERVVAEKGSKRVMLKNVQRAKFDAVLVPVSRVALAPRDQPLVDFDAFFTHTLMHELMHGLGPQRIRLSGRESSVRLELKDTYSAIEEAKADVSGLWALQQLVDAGRLDRSLERTMYATFLASAFRSIRFGIAEAHGRGQALQLNRLLDAGGFRVAADGTFAVDSAKVKAAVSDLTRELMTIEARGDYAGAKALLEAQAVVRPETQRVLDRLREVPVDIEPRFTAVDELTATPE